MSIKALLSGIMLAGMLASGASQAVLIDRGGGLIYDDKLDITWLQDARYAYTTSFSPNGKMSWQATMNWAANLTYLDIVRGVKYSDWRVPTGGEFSYLFYTGLGGLPYSNIYGPHNSNFNLFKDIQTSDWYWTSTAYAHQQPELYAVNFSFSDGTQSAHMKDNNYYAWAVRDGDVAAVPEPSSFALLALALGGLAVSRMKWATN